MTTRMNTLVTREERKHENRRTLIVLLGVMVLLIAISVVTIWVKH
jgi:Tfp pilus assembly protein PilN